MQYFWKNGHTRSTIAAYESIAFLSWFSDQVYGGLARPPFCLEAVAWGLGIGSSKAISSALPRQERSWNGIFQSIGFFWTKIKCSASTSSNLSQKNSKMKNASYPTEDSKNDLILFQQGWVRNKSSTCGHVFFHVCGSWFKFPGNGGACRIPANQGGKRFWREMMVKKQRA